METRIFIFKKLFSGFIDHVIHIMKVWYEKNHMIPLRDTRIQDENAGGVFI
jgi:hypothetical protein